MSVKGRFVTLCGRTRESSGGGWDGVYAGISLMPCLPGKKHKERNHDQEFLSFALILRVTAACTPFSPKFVN